MGTIAAILDENEYPTNAPHPSGQKRQNARIPHILGTQRAANMEIKPHISRGWGGGGVRVYFDWWITWDDISFLVHRCTNKFVQYTLEDLQSRTKVVGTLELGHISPIPPNQCWKISRFFQQKEKKKSPDYQHCKWGEGRACSLSQPFCPGLSKKRI